MSKQKLIILSLVATGITTLLLMIAPLSWQYFQTRTLTRQLFQIRQELAQPLQIHQAIRRLNRAQISNGLGDLELSLSQLESVLASPSAELDPEFILALTQAHQTSQARYLLVSRLLAYDVAQDLFVTDLTPTQLTTRSNTAVEAITKIQAQVKSLETDISPASLNFIRVSNQFIETISVVDQLEIARASQAKTALDTATMQFIREPFTLPEFVEKFEVFNAQIESLIERETELLNHSALRIDDTQIDQGLE